LSARGSFAIVRCWHKADIEDAYSLVCYGARSRHHLILAGALRVRQSRANPLVEAGELDTLLFLNILESHVKIQTENHGVGGSIPPLGTTSMFSFIR
jgi:hypothetical protein